jgi:hypothetical protein
MDLSEESNDAYLLKKIEEATKKTNRAKDVTGIGFLISIIFLFLGLLIFHLLGFLFLLLGLPMFAGGNIVSKYYDDQRKNYFRKLKVIPNFTTVCPNCKKNLPAYYANKCIFCGFNPYHPERKIKGDYKKLILIPVCPNCKKRLPKDDSAFCIYCGKTLKS